MNDPHTICTSARIQILEFLPRLKNRIRIINLRLPWESRVLGCEIFFTLFVTIFGESLLDIKTKSADILLKMVIVLNEMRIGYNCVHKINGL